MVVLRGGRLAMVLEPLPGVVEHDALTSVPRADLVPVASFVKHGPCATHHLQGHLACTTHHLERNLTPLTSVPRADPVQGYLCLWAYRSTKGPSGTPVGP